MPRRYVQFFHLMQLSTNIRRTEANEDEPLFTSPEGHLIHYRNFIQRVFKKAVIKADLPNITFHDPRRTYVTILIASGASQKVVQERLGHRSISTTLALYAQGTEKGHIDAANATQQYLNLPLNNVHEDLPLAENGLPMNQHDQYRHKWYLSINKPIEQLMYSYLQKVSKS